MRRSLILGLHSATILFLVDFCSGIISPAADRLILWNGLRLNFLHVFPPCLRASRSRLLSAHSLDRCLLLRSWTHAIAACNALAVPAGKPQYCIQQHYRVPSAAVDVATFAGSVLG